MAYTDKQILDRLREHLIDNLGSVWTMHKPSWQGVQKRMKKDSGFDEKVRNIVAEANYAWEKIGLTALKEDNTNFNVTLYKHFTQNKKSFLSHEVLELEDRIKELEDEQARK